MSALGFVLGGLGFLVFSWIVLRLIYLLIRRMESRKRENFDKRDN